MEQLKVLPNTNLFDTSIPKLFMSKEKARDALFCNSKSSKKCSVTACYRRAKLVAQYKNGYTVICDKCYYPYWIINEFTDYDNVNLIASFLFQID
jgi:hypothetical protein